MKTKECDDFDKEVQVDNVSFGVTSMNMFGYTIIADDSNFDGIMWIVYKKRKCFGQFGWLCDAVEWCQENKV